MQISLPWLDWLQSVSNDSNNKILLLEEILFQHISKGRSYQVFVEILKKILQTRFVITRKAPLLFFWLGSDVMTTQAL